MGKAKKMNVMKLLAPKTGSKKSDTKRMGTRK